MFEISIIERDNQGNPVLKPDGSFKKRYFKSDSADAISDFWHRNGNHKKTKVKTRAAVSEKEIKEGIKEAVKLSDRIQAKKNEHI